MEPFDALWRRFLERTDYERCVRPRAARLGLESVRGLLARLGDPQRGAFAVHLAGSKGKGSTAHFLERGARAAGLRTGLYTSPHLEDWRERIRLDGQPISAEAVAPALRAVLDAARGGETFFDLLTAAAFVSFRAAGCEFWVVETGLGGRFDSTNVLLPRAAVVTSIEREHEEVLGPGLAAIAAEKAGILKAGAQAWCGPLRSSQARAVIEERAAALGLRLRRADPAAPVRADLPFPQAPMRANFALARALLAGLAGEEPRCAAAARALDELPPAELRIPGRWEIRTAPGGQPVILDIAHTAESLGVLLPAFREAFPERHRGILLGLRDDKEPASLAAVLGPPAPGESWWTLPAGDHPRSADPRRLAPHFHARPLARPGFPAGPECFLVTGSTYLVGALRPRTTPSPT